MNTLHEDIRFSLADLLNRYPALVCIESTLQDAYRLLLDAAYSRHKFLVAGNGGSASDAEHIVGELMKSFVRSRPIDKTVQENLVMFDPDLGSVIASRLQGALPAICLSSHQALNTAFANDVDPSLAYAQQVYGYGEAGDLFWGISTSGNAKNVLQAALVAKAMGMRVFGMTGEHGGALKALCDVCLQVPERETYKIQELHLPIYHWLCIALEQSFW